MTWLQQQHFTFGRMLRVYRLEVLSVVGLLFWYLALFPGRLGYDYALAIRLIQRGESTNFWTGLYFYFLKVTTFDGNSIALTSLIGVVTLASSLWWFIHSIPIKSLVLRRIFLIICCTPFVGVFGVTVSHDVFQTSGIFLLLGLIMRIYLSQEQVTSRSIVIFQIATMMLLTTQSGLVIAVCALSLFLIRKKYMIALLSLLFMFATLTISNLGIANDSTSKGVNFLIFDLKCISQHPEARITSQEWDVLNQIAPLAQWKDPISCTNGDAQLSKMSINYDVAKFNTAFFREYFSIAFRNPAIAMMAHIQRSRGALPPPFFQGPDNQVNLDPTVPIGIHSNIALQDGPELLHPSIDEPSVNKKIPILKPLEFIAQIPTFLVNQASWFWGWGGLWLWPIAIFYAYFLRIRKVHDLLILIQPLVINHLLMVILGPGPLGRYYMSSILVGIICTLAILLSLPGVRKEIQIENS
jgi:hypothetical protein